MHNQELITYIKDQLQKGIAPSIITTSLMQKGWKQEDILQALNEINQKPPVSSSSFSYTNPNAPVQEETYADNYYPVTSIERIQNPSRFFAIPIIGGVVRLILMLPVYFGYCIIFGFASFFVLVINSFFVLFKGEYWNTAYTFNVAAITYMTKLFLYGFGLSEIYPGLNTQTKDFTLTIPLPEKPNRFFAIPLLGGLVRGILMIPYSLYWYVLLLAASIGSVAASFVVLIKGYYPESIFELVRDSMRIQNAGFMYYTGLSDRYPSFSISWNHKWKKVTLIAIGVLYILINLTISIVMGISSGSNALQKSGTLSSLTSAQQKSISSELGFTILTPALPIENTVESTYGVIPGLASFVIDIKKDANKSIYIAEFPKTYLDGSLEKAKSTFHVTPVPVLIGTYQGFTWIRSDWGDQKDQQLLEFRWADEERMITVGFTPPEQFTLSEVEGFLTNLYGREIKIQELPASDSTPSDQSIQPSSTPIGITLAPTPTPTPSINYLDLKEVEEKTVENGLAVYLITAWIDKTVIRTKIRFKNNSSAKKDDFIDKVQIIARMGSSNTAIPEWGISPLPEVSLLPGESREVEVSFRMPEDRLYPYTFYYYPDGAVSVLLGYGYKK